MSTSNSRYVPVTGKRLVNGTNNRDMLMGTNTNDTIYAYAGDDRIIGSKGIDIIDGGIGYDILDYRNNNGAVTIYMEGEMDRSSSSNEPYTADVAYATNVEEVHGSNYNDVIYGTTGNDVIYSHGGDDVIYGFDYAVVEAQNWALEAYAGDDIIHAGEGNNDITLGLGNNTITAGNGNNYINQNLYVADKYYAEDATGLLGTTDITLGRGEHNSIMLSAAYRGVNVVSAAKNNSIYIFNTMWSWDNLDGVTFGSYNIDFSGSVSNESYNNVYLENSLGGLNYSGGAGDDTVYISNIQIADHFGKDAVDQFKDSVYKIDLGDGQNSLQAYNVIGDMDVTGGNGEDQIQIDTYYGNSADRYTVEAMLKYTNNINIDTGAGNDNIRVSAGKAHIDAGAGNDEIRLGDVTYNSVVHAGSGNDVIEAYGFAHEIHGEEGNDIIYLNAGYMEEQLSLGASLLVGGEGSDSYYIRSSFEGRFDSIIDNYDSDNGFDKLFFDFSNVTASWSGNDLVITGQGYYGNANIATVTILDYKLGSDYQMDEIHINGKAYSSDAFLSAFLTLGIDGDNNDNVLRGTDSDDIIFAHAGNDTIIGSKGVDVVDGGTGYDVVDYRHHNGPVTIYMEGEMDRQAWNQPRTADVVYATNVEEVHGSNYDDTIYGSAGHDVIFGHDGDDTIYGYDQAVLVAQNWSPEAYVGNDVIHAGEGDNDIHLGLGHNVVTAGDGNNSIMQDTQFNTVSDVENYAEFIGRADITLGKGKYNSVHLSNAFAGANIKSNAESNSVYINNIIYNWNSFDAVSLDDITMELNSSAYGHSSVSLYNVFNSTNITVGAGNSYVSIYNASRDNFVDNADMDLNFSASHNITLGEGDYNYFEALGAVGNIHLSAGDASNYISINNYYGSWEDEYTLEGMLGYTGNTSINLGDGGNQVNLYSGLASVVTGAGNDQVNLGNMTYSSIVDTGAGEDYIFVDTDFGHYICAGDGNDNIYLTGADMESGSAFGDTYLVGGNGNDNYNIYLGETDLSCIINNFDEDNGFDALSAYEVSDISASWNGNDLLIEGVSSFRDSKISITLEDYKLGSDYQIDEFFFGGELGVMSSDEFLMEFGLA